MNNEWNTFIAVFWYLVACTKYQFKRIQKYFKLDYALLNAQNTLKSIKHSMFNTFCMSSEFNTCGKDEKLT